MEARELFMLRPLYSTPAFLEEYNGWAKVKTGIQIFSRRDWNTDFSVVQSDPSSPHQMYYPDYSAKRKI
jgi:hypothetical protein